MDVYPQWDGYTCLPDRDWTSGALAFRVPPTTTSVVIWLRARGQGTAQFDNIELRPVR